MAFQLCDVDEYSSKFMISRATTLSFKKSHVHILDNKIKVMQIKIDVTYYSN